MSDAEIFTLALIEAVKKKPILYDPNHGLGEDKNTFDKNRVWNDIATELEENVRLIKTRWKGLKECYVKCKKSRSEKFCNPIYDQYRNWRWASYLEFMDPHLKGLRNIEDSSQNIEEFEYQEESINNQENETDIFDDSESNVDEPKSGVASPDNSAQVKLRKKNNLESEDDIDYLFLSYAETIRKLPPKKQIQIKLEMAKLFSRAEMESLEEKEKDPFT